MNERNDDFMNNKVKRAYEMAEWENPYFPELEVGEVVEINDVWDGEGDDPIEAGSYSYKVTDSGEDGESNCPVYLSYDFKIVEKKENPLDTLVKITNIDFI